MSLKPEEEDETFKEFVKGAKFKQCPFCKVWVEKSDGCDHMKCRCGMEFCYECGGVYKECECYKREEQ
jgi:E3 ubiquitin-protein ligase RNF144